MSSDVRSSVTAGIVAGGFLIGGKVFDWAIKRHAERVSVTVAEEAAEDDHEDSASSRYRQLWLDEQTRADRITAERNTMATEMNARIDGLVAQIQALNAQMAEKDSLIARQAAKLERLERQVKQLQEHDRGHKERPEP